MNSRILLLSAGALVVACSAHAQLLSENFTYSDGSLTSASGGSWVAHGSGTAVPVADGAAVLAGGSGREDVNRSLGSVYTTGTLTVSFDVDLSAGSVAASGVNSYFLHFSDGGTANFRARVFVGSSSANDVDLFRIGIENDGNESSVSVAYSTDLDRTSPHSVVVSYDLDSRTSKLWVDSSVLNTPTAQDIVAATGIGMSAIAMRQGGTASTTGNYSGLRVDNLVVSYTAVPEPEEWAAIAGAGLVGFALWRRRR